MLNKFLHGSKLIEPSKMTNEKNKMTTQHLNQQYDQRKLYLLQQ